MKKQPVISSALHLFVQRSQSSLRTLGSTAALALFFTAVALPVARSQSLPGLQEEVPPGNPGLPSGVAEFTPPTGSSGPDSQSPIFTEATRMAKPGETLAMVGHRFSTFAGEESGKDTRFLTYSQTTSTDGLLREGLIQKLEGSFAGVTLPTELPQDGMVLVWAQNEAGNSLPVAVNRTEAWWVGPDAAAVGEKVAVYGTNLTSGPNRDVASIYLVRSGTTSGVWVSANRANPYRVEFTVPNGTTNGDYELWIHNHRGGRFGWSTPRKLDGTPMTLQVRTVLNWTGPVINVKDPSYGAVGDGVADDSPAIANAIAAASAHVTANPQSRPTVFLPEGTYNLYSPLTAASNIRIQGDGRDAQGNWKSRIQRAEGPRVTISFTGNTNDLTRNNNHAIIFGNPVISTASGSGWKSPLGGITFDGASYLALPNSQTLDFGGRIALVTRIKGVVSTASSPAQTLFVKSVGAQKVFARIRAGLVEFGYNLGAGDVVVSTPFNFNTSSTAGWATVSFVYNGSAWQIYQSGALRASRTDAQGVPAMPGVWQFGGDPSGAGDYLTGQVDMLRIYARSLAPTELTGLGNAWTDEAVDVASIVSPTALTGTEFDNFEVLNVVTHFTTQQPMGQSIFGLLGTDLVVRNMKISARFFRGLSVNSGSYRVKLLDSTIVSNTNFTDAVQMEVDNVDFFGTGDAEQMLAADGGAQFLSLSNCRASDFQNTGLWEHSAGGRFFTGSVGAGSQRFIYIADNVTTDLAPRPGKADQNAGEQILWDQNAGNLVRRTFAGAAANSVTIQEWVGASSIGNTDSILISGGLGVGQYRRILARDVATGMVTVDRPWDVVPDATSIILSGKVVSNVAIYQNHLDGKSDYATRVTASSGVNFFNNGNDTIIDSNVISDVRSGINLNGYTQGTVSLPVQNVVVVNNEITNVNDALKMLGAPNLAQPALLATVWRNNTASNITESGIEANTGVLNIFEGNTFVNLPIGVGFVALGSPRTEALILKDNIFNRGTAPAAGSTGIILTNNTGYHGNPTLVGNTFTGFETLGTNISTNRYGAKYTGSAVANNGKVYGALGLALTATAVDAIQVFDPANPLVPPTSFMRAVAGGLNGNLSQVSDVLFTNPTYVGPFENPVNCSLFTANTGSGTVSRYDFDFAGTMTYLGDVITDLGRPSRLARDFAGNLYILSTDSDLITAGSQPRVYKWNGSTVSVFIDTPLFRYGTNVTTRVPGGLAVDGQGRVYVSYTTVPGSRRFKEDGTFDVDIPVGGSQVKIAGSGMVYISSTSSIVEYNPNTAVLTTIVNSTTLPAIAGQSSITSFVFGPAPASDLTANGSPSIYLTTSGGFFLGVSGPGSTQVGSQIALRDFVYPQLQMPLRNVAITAGSNSSASASLAVKNVSVVDSSYSVVSSQPWLTVSPSSGTFNALQNSNLVLTANAAGLPVGLYVADVTVTYNNIAGSAARVIKAEVRLSVSASQPSLENLNTLAVGDSLAQVRVTVDPRSSSTAVFFEYGLDDQLGTSFNAGSVPPNSGSSQVSATLPGLFPHTTYYYRATAQNGAGNASTQIGTFKTAPQSDINRDGLAELVTLSPSSRVTELRAISGNSTAGPMIPIDLTLCAVADMNLDAKADWVLIRPETRQVVFWMMDGATVTQTVNGPQLPATCDLQAVEDFDGDGNMDLLVRDGSDSTLQIRFLDAGGVEVQLMPLNPAVPAGFVVVGVDFVNQAGVPDILITNPATGESRYLTYDGSTTLVSTTAATIPPNWLLSGVDAYNGGENADWLVYHPSTGATEIWTMDGASKVSAAAGPTLTGDHEPVGARSAVTSQTSHNVRFSNGAAANNGKIYLAMNRTLNATSGPAVMVFDPAQPSIAPTSFLNAVAGGLNGHLNGTRGILFTNSAFAGVSANPVNCSMYLLNNVGTLSKYDFDASGTMTYVGDILSGLGNGLDLAWHPSGDLLILTTDSDLVASGRQPRLYRWNGSNLTVHLDTTSFRYGTTTTTRNPGGVAVDAQGNIYIPFTDVTGTRRFPAGGGNPFEIPSSGEAVRVGADGNVYWVRNLSIQQYNPTTNVVRQYLGSSQIPTTAGQTRYIGLVFGMKSLRDLNPGAPETLFSSSSGNRFFGANGPGSANPGTQAW